MTLKTWKAITNLKKHILADFLSAITVNCTFIGGRGDANYGVLQPNHIINICITKRSIQFLFDQSHNRISSWTSVNSFDFLVFDDDRCVSVFMENFYHSRLQSLKLAWCLLVTCSETKTNLPVKSLHGNQDEEDQMLADHTKHTINN